MQRTVSVWVVAVAFMVAGMIVGCGGGGGGGTGATGSSSGTNSGSTGAPAAGQYLEFFRSGTGRVNPLSLQTGIQYYIEFVNYDTFGSRTVLNASNFTKSGSGSAAVTLTNTGLLTLTSNPGGLVTISATATVAGSPRTVSQDVAVAITGSTAQVRGRLLSTDGVTPLTNVQVEFYDEGNNYAGSVLTGGDGRFVGTVRTTARRLTLKGDTIPTPYYKSMRYQGQNYAIAGLSCPLVLPTLSAGQNYVMPESIFISRKVDGPPPPPSGCN